MSTGGQGTKWRRNLAENFNRLSRAHERYRRQTDDRRTCDMYTTKGRKGEERKRRDWRKYPPPPKKNIKVVTVLLPSVGCRLLCFSYNTCSMLSNIAQLLGSPIELPTNPSTTPHPLPSDRQHLSCDVCLEVRGEIIRTVLCCIVY